MKEPIRILVGKPGLDGHDRGAKVISSALKDAGMEVIYTGIRQTPEQIVNTAIQEDVEAIGLSILSGAHNILLPKIVELLDKNGAGNIKVFAGGVIPDEDIEFLKDNGISDVFTPGSSLERVVDVIKQTLNRE